MSAGRNGGVSIWLGDVAGASPGAVCVGLLVLLGVGYQNPQTPDLGRNNRYNAVFVELLGHSPNPARDLVDLGLSPELARYAGRPIYVPGNATRDPHFAGFFTTVTEVKLAAFHLTHPGRAVALAHRGATASMYLRPTGVSPPLGNQTIDSGAPPYYTACKAMTRGGAQPVALLLLVSSAVILMAVALLGEGACEIVKHLFQTSACDALILVFTIHGVGLLVVQAQHRNREGRARDVGPAAVDAKLTPAPTAVSVCEPAASVSG